MHNTGLVHLYPGTDYHHHIEPPGCDCIKGTSISFFLLEDLKASKYKISGLSEEDTCDIHFEDEPSDPPQEKILKFGDICYDLVDSNALHNNVKSNKILVFDDGVSEGEFGMWAYASRSCNGESVCFAKIFLLWRNLILEEHHALLFAVKLTFQSPRVMPVVEFVRESNGVGFVCQRTCTDACRT
ncbi:eukaryotic translation initiation factor 2c [Dorcoceras hygrometricum]|uniref:Eukaryotic translation initiation factor 2c n=1 Tax=Dorcoceras hygrometricum TaxID=472368 RepID=A0A2Z7B4W1_9LAMI|nr:eukaryotic translation initiation factor 2c [Dorcoceras hygrometricum]